MNDAHFHLAINHFPIVGLIIATAILVFATILKSKILTNTAYVILVFVALFGFLSMYSGEQAEEMLEKSLPEIGHNVIHEHEEMAEKLALFLYASGLLSLLGLYLNYKNHAKSKIIALATIGCCLVGLYFAQNTSTTGGEIRHTEIRTESTSTEQNTIGNDGGQKD